MTTLLISLSFPFYNKFFPDVHFLETIRRLNIIHEEYK